MTVRPFARGHLPSHPATDSLQVELHPALPQPSLLQYCSSKNILLTAYSPLGQKSSPFFSDPALNRIGAKFGGTAAQVVLSWGVQRGTVVIPKSESVERMVENISVSGILKFVFFDDREDVIGILIF